MADTTESVTPEAQPTPDTSGKTPDQIRADAIAAGIAQTKKDNPGWSGEGPWPPLEA